MAGKEENIMVYQPKRHYEWWDKFMYSVDANIVGGVVEQIEEKDGQVTKEAFLDVSRPENAPTHILFEWDNDIAAEKYRLNQSRKIINSLRIVYTDRENADTRVSAFIRTSRPGDKPVYENIAAALQDDNKREIVLNRLRGELDAFIIRNQHIEELADLLEEASQKARSASRR